MHGCRADRDPCPQNGNTTTDDTVSGDAEILAALTGQLRSTDPDLARHLTALAIPTTQPNPTPLAVLSSLALCFADTELFDYGVRNHPVWMLTAAVAFPFGLVPLIRSTPRHPH